MELSSKVRYALLVLKLASCQEQRFLQIDSIAAQQQISDHYLAQRLMRLRQGSLGSQRDFKGGYLLAKDSQQIRERTKKLEPGGQPSSTIEILKFKQSSRKQQKHLLQFCSAISTGFA
jgi:hypothetical protein